jgi:rhodanese-related sulfurtransferase
MVSMQRLLEYISQHYFLVAGAAVAALAVAIFEVRERTQAFAGLSTAQAVRLMNQGAIVLDLRPKAAYDSGHIGDARSVPTAEIESQGESLKRWRDKNVITYCETGANGASSARALTKMGFTKVFNLQGGINAWVKENLPLVKTSGKGGSK